MSADIRGQRMRLIDADALMPLFMEKAFTMKDRHGVKLGEDWLLNYNDIKDVIDNAPTIEQKVVVIEPDIIEKLADSAVDVISKIDWDKAIEAYKERPQGHWVSISGTNISKCSECQVRQILYDMQGDNFCPNCGADMRVKPELNTELNELNNERPQGEKRMFNPYDHRGITEI